MDKLVKTDTLPTINKIDDLLKFEKELSLERSAGKYINHQLIVEDHFIYQNQNQPGLKLTLDYIIELTSQSLGANLSSDIIRLMVETITSKYRYETFEDFIIIFKEIREGKFKYYHNFSLSWIEGCIKDYLDRKYQLRDALMLSDNIENPELTKEDYEEAKKLDAKRNELSEKEKEFQKYRTEFYMKRINKNN